MGMLSRARRLRIEREQAADDNDASSDNESEGHAEGSNKKQRTAKETGKKTSAHEPPSEKVFLPVLCCAEVAYLCVPTEVNGYLCVHAGG